MGHKIPCICGHSLRDHIKLGCEWYECKCEKYIRKDGLDLIRIKPIPKKKKYAGNIKGIHTFYIQDCGTDGKPIMIRSKKTNKQIKNSYEVLKH